MILRQGGWMYGESKTSIKYTIMPSSDIQSRDVTVNVMVKQIEMFSFSSEINFDVIFGKWKWQSTYHFRKCTLEIIVLSTVKKMETNFHRSKNYS